MRRTDSSTIPGWMVTRRKMLYIHFLLHRSVLHHCSHRPASTWRNDRVDDAQIPVVFTALSPFAHRVGDVLEFMSEVICATHSLVANRHLMV